jgi:subtilisin family serine protease
MQKTPNPHLPVPSIPQLLLFFLLLSWLVVCPIAVGIICLLLPATWPTLATNLLATAILAGLLFAPILGLAGLVRRRQWTSLRPFVWALVVTGLYIVAAAGIRAVTEPLPAEPRALPLLSETTLRLTILTLAALLVGGIGLGRAGVPKWMLPHAFGFELPPVAGLFTALAVVAILTVGWPLTGALGDSWVALLILLYTLALCLPEEILFRGAILGIITFNFQHRKALAAFIAILIYIAFTPSQLVPRGDWAKLILLVTAIPLAVLLTELRALTGSIWPGVLFAWAYRAAPLLFADSRVELPLITEPWQTAARLWMVVGAGGLALLLWAGRTWLAPRWRLSNLTTVALALVVALVLWAGWLGLWFAGGYPGFYNDGFLIIMAEQADLNGAKEIDDLLARREFVRTRLIETAQSTQEPVRAALDAAGLDYRPFYLINMIRVEGHHRRMQEFANLPGVAQVMLNPNVRPYPHRVSTGYGSTPEEGQGVGWNISQTGADAAWALGVTGRGIVVAGQDTGYDWQHPALKNAYRGQNGSGEASHAYNWHDAWSDAAEPFDDDRHGTHTMGTILGDDDQGNQIGMAPGAVWIGCRNMQRGIGNPASYTDCMEFFLAPYPTGGDPFTDGDISQAPHVINNSWGCPDIEGCDDNVLEPATEALRAAGIMMVVSAGNDGPACETVTEPPARYDDVFSVGASTENGLITGFSSRGPVPDGANGANERSPLLKPDITAPGDNVRSSVPGGGYGVASGTSMAGPHVAGLVALLWSANPALIGQIDATEQIIRQSAQPVEVDTTCPLNAPEANGNPLMDEMAALEVGNACACGEVSGTPNNVYGWGEIDALAAVKLALAYESGK